jgi:tripartite-type tricarboxylate transporter receptor subunit TctC
MKPTIRYAPRCVCAAAIVATASSLSTAGALAATPAQNYPHKPVRIIIMSSPASGPDILGRMIGSKLGEIWGQQFVVDNRAGASGSIGAEIAANSAPDGYTLLMVTSQAAIVTAMFDKLSYNLVRDFTPISYLASTPFIMVVNPSVPAASVKDLIALAKGKPGELKYGLGGSGSPPHLAAEVFKSMTVTDLLHVPYKSVSPALTDTISGQIQMTISVVPMVMPTVKAGKVRALGVTSQQRTPLAPELPAIAEFVPGFEAIGWYGLVAPAKTPPEIVAKLNAELVKLMGSADFRERLSTMGAVPYGTSAQEFGKHIVSEIDKARRIIKTAGVKPD